MASSPSAAISIPAPPRRASRQAPQLLTHAKRATIATSSSRVRANSPRHDKDAVPPAVATLLAITTIPLPAQRDRRNRAQRPLLVADDDVEGSTPASPSSVDISRTSSQATLSLLVGPLDENVEDFLTSPSYPHGDEGPSPHSLRSTSSDSVPSLETDDDDGESVLSISSVSSPYTPRGRSDRSSLPRVRSSSVGLDSRLRLISSTPEDCLMEHPLLLNDEDDEDDEGYDEDSKSILSVTPLTVGSNRSSTPVRPSSPTPESTAATAEHSFLSSAIQKQLSLRRLKPLKSNLTASLRAIRSAAIRLSAAIPTPPSPQLYDDDSHRRYLLARGLLSAGLNPPYTDEKRPRREILLLSPDSEPEEFGEIADGSLLVAAAEVRRYLNPPTGSVRSPNNSTSDNARVASARRNSVSSIGLGISSVDGDGSQACSGAIQMQTYNSNVRPRSSKSKLKPDASSPFVIPPPGSADRPREIRENPDFLRILVLELNMIREGRFEPGALFGGSGGNGGKARFVLPPRQQVRLAGRRVGECGERWKGWCVDEL